MREIELKPSRLLGLLLLGGGGLVLAAISMADLPAGIALVLAGAAIGLGAWCWRRTLRTASLRIAPDGRLQCLDDAAGWHDAEVLGDSFVSAALIVLRYRLTGPRVRSLTLLPDSAEPEDLRRLRVWLRWGRRTRSDTGFPGAG